MKGIVADIKGKYAVVLTRDGSFVKVKNYGNCKVGCEMDLDRPAAAKARIPARLVSLAAGALLVLGIGYGAYSYTVPYTYVDVDINPSFEIAANIYDRIIKTEGLNEEGQKLIQSGSLKHARLEEGIAAILDMAVEQGYIKNEAEENAVLLSVICDDPGKSEKVEAKVQAAAKTELESKGVEMELVVEKASRERQNTAKELGITPGKLNLIEKAMDAEPGLKVDDLKNARVKDIMKQIKDSRKAGTQEKQDSKKDSGQKPGNGPNKADRSGKNDSREDNRNINRNDDKKGSREDNRNNIRDGDKKDGREDDRNNIRDDDRKNSREDDRSNNRNGDKKDSREDNRDNSRNDVNNKEKQSIKINDRQKANKAGQEKTRDKTEYIQDEKNSKQKYIKTGPDLRQENASRGAGSGVMRKVMIFK